MLQFQYFEHSNCNSFKKRFSTVRLVRPTEEEFPFMVEYIKGNNDAVRNPPHGNNQSSEEFLPTDKRIINEAKKQLNDGVPLRRVYRNIPKLRNRRQLINLSSALRRKMTSG
jgi:hypothetical protein